ncbi:methyltransferase domain-containing protein [Nocardia amamiensis]|uniref:Methyltransferase domain-containing protein n=1 Tax=Nocardia amamiensis TaxID=404578 RepID=A0ABS0CHQ2_9NOCA|nr:class I SAM-dependent methyltransferase [Nocardia amamiensis]MBF6296142.1 methyltransferase domain-containing protein [Nocardia amamiensis]
MLDSTEDPADRYVDVTATRIAYDDVAERYTELVRHQLAGQPLDRAMLAVFAELVADNGSGPIADLGCGPGRITAHLATLGARVFGIDLSPRMIALARAEYPHLSFDQGSLEQLPIGDGELGGIVAWYSLIHIPPARVPQVLGEFSRVLADKGHLLLAFQTADASDAVEAFDHKVTRAYRWAPKKLARLLTDAGFTMITRMVREPRPDERFGQAYLLAAKVR